MNKLSKKFGMKDTKFMNPHGMGTLNKINISSARDCLTMSLQYIKDPFLLEVCNTKQYTCHAYVWGKKKEWVWKNTNKLLGVSNVRGLKTGITPSAGPCLSTLFEYN